jgi:beta-lactamase superfamily II metal-dependent hydrolase
MIRLEMLPAAFGDCLLLSYGSEGGAIHRVLIDAGLKGTFKEALKPRLESIGQGSLIDLVVVTHLDRDHICGMLPLVEQMPSLVRPGDIWFNGHDHLIEDALGVAEAEALGKLIRKKSLPWNEAFDQKAVVVSSASGTTLPQRELPGGARITLLSPYREQLEALAAKWDDDSLGSWDEEPQSEAAAASIQLDMLGKRPPLSSVDVNTVLELADVDFEEDDAPPNGSSIAFVFELGDRRILFGADAFPSVLARSLRSLVPDGERYKVDAFKLPHHGSMSNLSPELLDLLDCHRFLVSTNGGSFGHPHPEAIARILTAASPEELCFNYRSPYTSVWEDSWVQNHFNHYKARFPGDGERGYVLELTDAGAPATDDDGD